MQRRAQPYQSISPPGKEQIEPWHARTPPLYLVAGSVVIGDGAGLVLHLSLWPAVALTLAALGLFACRRPGWGLAMAMGAIALAASNTSSRLYCGALLPNDIRRLPQGAQVRLEGVLDRAPERANDGWRLYLRLERAGARGALATPAVGEVRVIALGDAAYTIGQRLAIDARLRFPRNLGNPGEFNYAAYLARQRIVVTALAQPGAIAILGRAPAGLEGVTEAMRERIGQLIDSSLEQPQRGELRALIIGDRGQLQGRLREAFALTGMAHLLVISGLHLGFVAGAAFALVRLLCWMFPYLLIRGWANKLAAGGAGLAALAYAAIAGGHISTLRALIMVACYVAAVLADRGREVMASLALAALLICLALPGSSLDIGFQLSFAAVTAVVLGMRRFALWQQRLRLRWPLPESARIWPLLARAGEMVAGAGAVSFFALLGTAPLTAYYFNQFSLVGIFANAVVVPIMAVGGVIVGLSAVALGLLWHAPGVMLLRLSSLAITLSNRLALMFLALPGAWLRSFTPTLLELTLMYVLLMLWLTTPITSAESLPTGAPAADQRRWRRVAAVLCILTLAGDGAWWLRQRYFNPTLQVTFLAMGQGASAAVVQFPGSAVMLIYGERQPGNSELGEREIAPFLWSRKILHLDYLLLSHPEHANPGRHSPSSLRFLTQNFHPGALWTSRAIATDPKSQTPRAGRSLELLDTAMPARRLGGVTVQCLNPAPGFRGPRDEGSIVLQLSAGRVSFLFSGELDRVGQRQLLQRYPGLRATVLEVPHRASLASFWAPFVDAVAPAFAIAQVGYDNRYHSPGARVVEGYRAVGARLLRTDREGAIGFRLDRGQLRWWTGRALLGPG